MVSTLPPTDPEQGPSGRSVHYSSRRRNRNNMRRPAVRQFVAVFSAAVLILTLAGWGMQQRYFSQWQTDPVFAQLDEDQRPAVPDEADGAMNILVVGSDDRDGMTREERLENKLGLGDFGHQSDSMMLLHVGKDPGNISIVSLPRDTLATIPAYTDASGNTHDAHLNKLNAAFALGGAPLTIRTIEDLTDVRIDHYLEISFRGFLQMVDALDGVDVCLEKPIKDKKYTGLNLKAGKHTLRGKKALGFVRSRHGHSDSDFGRMKSQQQFAAGMMRKAMSKDLFLNPLRLDQFLSGAMDSIQTDDELTREDIFTIAKRVQGTAFDEMTFTTVPVSDENYSPPGTNLTYTMLWNETKATELFDAIRHDRPLPETKQKKKSTKKQAESSKESTPLVPAEQIQLQVFNGTGAAGLAAKITEQLRERGFTIAGEPGNSEAHAASTFRLDASYTDTKDELQRRFPQAHFESIPELGKTIEVIVGADWEQTLAPGLSKATKVSNPEPTENESAKNEYNEESSRTGNESICG